MLLTSLIIYSFKTNNIELYEIQSVFIEDRNWSEKDNKSLSKNNTINELQWKKWWQEMNECWLLVIDPSGLENYMDFRIYANDWATYPFSPEEVTYTIDAMNIGDNLEAWWTNAILHLHMFCLDWSADEEYVIDNSIFDLSQPLWIEFPGCSDMWELEFRFILKLFWTDPEFIIEPYFAYWHIYSLFKYIRIQGGGYHAWNTMICWSCNNWSFDPWPGFDEECDSTSWYPELEEWIGSTERCTLGYCGDGYVDNIGEYSFIEECDDWNNINGDGCDNNCTDSCWNGVCDPWEEIVGQESCCASDCQITCFWVPWDELKDVPQWDIFSE